MNRPLKERKIQLCEIVADYMDKMDPGNKNSRRKLQVYHMKINISDSWSLIIPDYDLPGWHQDWVVELGLQERCAVQRQACQRFSDEKRFVTIVEFLE